MAPYLRETQEGVEVALLVQPRASRTRVVGEHDGRLKVALAAPPVDGAANDALIDFLADCLKVGRRTLRLAHATDPRGARRSSSLGRRRRRSSRRWRRHADAAALALALAAAPWRADAPKTHEIDLLVSTSRPPTPRWNGELANELEQDRDRHRHANGRRLPGA